MKLIYMYGTMHLQYWQFGILFSAFHSITVTTAASLWDKWTCLHHTLSVYTEAETACQKWGGSAFTKWEVIHILLNRLLVFNTFFVTTSNFGGAQPPLSKSGGAQAPPAPPPPPRFSASDTDTVSMYSHWCASIRERHLQRIVKYSCMCRKKRSCIKKCRNSSYMCRKRSSGTSANV